MIVKKINCELNEKDIPFINSCMSKSSLIFHKELSLFYDPEEGYLYFFSELRARKFKIKLNLIEWGILEKQFGLSKLSKNDFFVLDSLNGLLKLEPTKGRFYFIKKEKLCFESRLKNKFYFYDENKSLKVLETKDVYFGLINAFIKFVKKWKLDNFKEIKLSDICYYGFGSNICLR